MSHGKFGSARASQGNAGELPEAKVGKFARAPSSRRRHDQFPKGHGIRNQQVQQKRPQHVRNTGISTLATLALFSKEQISAANLSRWALLLTFPVVGLRTNVRALSKQGLKPFLVGAIGEIATAGFTLGLVLAAQRFRGW